MHGLTERAVERILAVLHTEPDDPEVMGATSTAVAAATPDGDRLSPDSVLSVQPLSSASKPLTPQRLGGKPLGTPAGSRRPQLTAAPPPPLQSSPRACSGRPFGPERGGLADWMPKRGCGSALPAHSRRSRRLATTLLTMTPSYLPGVRASEQHLNLSAASPDRSEKVKASRECLGAKPSRSC